jgi:peptidoglycan-associated lipoprotein
MSFSVQTIYRRPAIHRCGPLVRSISIALLLILPFVTPSQAGPSQAGGYDRQPASEMLDDGLEALRDDLADVAEDIFRHLVIAYPDSAEASRARRELEKLGSGASEPSPTLAVAHSVSPRMAAWRRQFVQDVGDRVFFAESSTGLGGRARIVIDSQAAWLNQRPDLTVTLIGRADDGGNDAAADALAQQRAEMVRQQLIQAGVSPRRVAIESRGRSDPVALCTSALCKSQNRHVETRIGDPQNAAAFVPFNSGEWEASNTATGAVRDSNER